MKRPKVSVVMPIYNVELYLRECLDSVVSQTLLDIEIIAVNDGSPDSCGEIIDCYALKDSRIKAIHKKNGGYGSAVNAGIDKASGEYLAIVESDDYVSATMLETLYSKAIAEKCDISRGSYYVVQNEVVKGVCNPLGCGQGVFSVKDFPRFLVTPPAIWSAIYSLDFIRSNSLRVIDTPGASYQDVDFFVRSSIVAKRISCLADPLYYYRLDNPNSSTNSLSKSKAIFDNYSYTDTFVFSKKGLQKEVLFYYEKRKICDFQWHFKRVSAEFRYKYLLQVSREIRLGDVFRLRSLLTFDQLMFSCGALVFPFLYAYLYSLKLKIFE